MNIVDILQTVSKVKTGADGSRIFSENFDVAIEKIAATEGTTNGLAKGLNAVSAATGLSSAAILKYAGIAGVAIAGVSIAVQQYKKHWEELNAQADAASESYTSTVSSIEEYKSQITSLKSSLASGNLSEEEAYNVRVQLLSIQDELIEKYGLEANALNILGEAADTTNEKLEGITRDEALRNLDENKKAYENAAKKMEEEWVFQSQVSGDELEVIAPALSEISEKYPDLFKMEGDGYLKTITIRGDTTEAKNALSDLYDALLDLENVSPSRVASIRSWLGDVEEVFDEYHDRYESYLIQSIAADPETSGIMNTVEGYVTAMQTAISSGDWSALSENIDLLSGINLDDYDLPKNIKSYIQGIIDEAVAAAEEHEVEIQLDTKFNKDTNVKSQVKEYLKAFEDEAGSIDYAALQNASIDLTSVTAEQAQAYQMIQILCGAYGATVLQVTGYLAENGEVTLQVAEATAEETAEVKELNDVLSTTAERYSTLSSAMAEMSGGDELSYETTVALIKELTEAGEDWLNYLTIENGKIKLNTAAYQEYANAEANALLAGLRAEEASLQAGLGEVGSGYELASASGELSAVQEKIAIIESLLAESKSEVTEFFNAFDTGASKLSVIDEIREAVSTGGFSNSQALEWIQEIPELAPYYDAATNSFYNLENALNGIVDTGVSSFIEQTNAYLEENADLTDEARAEVVALQGAYVDLANQTKSTNKYTALLNKGVTSTTKPFAKIKKQISNLWNSDVFSDARSDLVALAKSSGITAKDILDLAEDNEYLQAMLDESGVSAALLAQSFEGLSLSGSGALDGITEDAIRVNTILSEMDGYVKAYNESYQKYQSNLGSNEYNEGYSNYQEAYAALGEMFENGTYGKDFYRTIDYLYGEGHGADGIESLYAQYKKLGDFFGEADNGLGFLEKLYDNRDILSDLESSIKLDSNGNYIWDIKPEDFSAIGDALGLTTDQVAACVEALGMFGNFSEYDTKDLIATFKDLDMALIDTEGNATLSKQAVRSMLESLGLESWQIDQIIAQLEEAEGIRVIDFDIQGEEEAESLLADLQQLGGLTIDGNKIGLSSFKDLLKDTFNMSTEEIAAFMEKLHELGYIFVDATGKVVPFSTAIESLNDTKLEDLKREAESAKKALAEILGGYDIEINLETSDLGESKENIKTLSNMLSTFRGKDGKIDFSIEGATEVATMLEYAIRQKQELTKPAIMEFNMSGVDGEVASAVTTVQAFVDAYNEIEVAAMLGLDTTEAQQKKDELWQQIQDINPEILVNLGIDPSSEQAALQTIYSMDGESIANALVEYDVNTDQVEAYKSSDKDTEAEVDYKADFSAVVKAKAPDKTAKLKYTADFTAVASTPAPKKYGTIYYSASYAGGTTTAKKAQSSSKGAYTGFTSEARVGGTAYAGGNWATKKDEFSLVGEIAPEIIVDTKTGTWKLLGEHGTEFANIPKGSIIFNHLQTKALLSKGKISGRGKAYVGGTTGKTNPATGTSYTSSYKKANSTSSSSSNSTSSSSSLSSATEEADEFLETIDWIEVALDRVERKVNSLDITTSSTFKTASARLSSVKKELSAITEEIEKQETASKAYFSAAEEVDLSDDYKALVRSGAPLIEDITDEALSENISQYKELYEKGLDAADAVGELKEQFSELYQTSFEIISTKMDSIISVIESKHSTLEEYLEQVEAMGRKVSANYYLALIDSQREIVGKLTTKRSELQKALDEAVSSGAIEKYSESWYEMSENIEEVTSAINEATTSVIEYKNELRTLKWDAFDDGVSSVGHLNEEADFLLDLLDRMDSFSDSGKITDDGLTKLGLYAQKYNTYMAQADLYAKEIFLIEKQLAEDPSNIDLIERKQELIEAQREAIEAAEDEKDSMINLVEEGIQVQLDALSDLIDKYTDSLDSAKSLYDYQKKIAEKTKEIASIEKQISAYEGGDSEELKKTVQELKVSLNEAEEDLEETQYDQYISDQKTLLENLYTQYEEVLNSRLDDVGGLISECIGAVNKNAEDVSSVINQAAKDVGYDLSENISDIWDMDSIINGQTNVLANYGEDFLYKMTSLIGVVTAIQKSINSLYDNSAAEGIIAQMKDNSASWGDVDEETRAGIHEQNKILAEQYKLATGEDIYYNSEFGTWHHENGSLLYGNDDEVVSKIVTKMRNNSSLWGTASSSKKKELESQNAYYAKYLSSILGQNIKRGEDGIWYMEDGTLLYDYIESLISAIVSKMKKNSASWGTSSDEKKETLSNENLRYGELIEKMTGKRVWRGDDGIWYIDGEELFKKYHTGLNQGLVGRSGLKDNEELAVLLSDEVVLTEGQWRSNVEKLTNGVSDTLGYAVEAMLLSIQDFIPENSASHVSGLLKTLDCPSSATEYNNEFNNTFVLNFKMQDVQNYEQFMTKMQNDKKFAQLVQEITLSQLTGSPSLAKNRIQF